MKPVYREDESIGGHEDWCSCRQCERERERADDEPEDRGRYEGGYRVFSDGTYREDFGGDR